LTEAITSADTPRNNLLMVVAGGLVSGILTPLLPTLIDQIVGLPGQLRISLIAVPFAVLVFAGLLFTISRSALTGFVAGLIVLALARREWCRRLRRNVSLIARRGRTPNSPRIQEC